MYSENHAVIRSYYLKVWRFGWRIRSEETPCKIMQSIEE